MAVGVLPDRLHVSTIVVMMTVDMTVMDLPTRCRPLDTPILSDAEAEGTALVFKALADPARIRIVNLLANSREPVCACEFIPVLGLTQATVSHHLKKLTDAGLLAREQRGKWAYFSLDPAASAQLAGLIAYPEVPR